MNVRPFDVFKTKLNALRVFGLRTTEARTWLWLVSA